MLIELGAGSTVVAGVRSRLAVAGLQDRPTTFEQLGSIDCVEARIAPSVAVRLVVVPRGLWHRHVDIRDLIELYFTPGESIQSSAKDPREQQ
jgi:hypothetical protein